jgi:hypothetical protein
MRPFGRPPMPSAMSRPSEPVEIDSISERLALAELHDRALAEGALDLGEGGVQGLVLVLHAFFLDHFQQRRHWQPPLCLTPPAGAAMRISPR